MEISKSLIIRLITRGLNYSQEGYALAAFFMGSLTFGTVLYYNNSLLQTIFSDYVDFIWKVGICFGAFFITLGYFYLKSPFYRAKQDLAAKRNQFQNKYLAPVGLPCWSLQCDVAEKLGVDPEKVAVARKLVADSEEYYRGQVQ